VKVELADEEQKAPSAMVAWLPAVRPPQALPVAVEPEMEVASAAGRHSPARAAFSRQAARVERAVPEPEKDLTATAASTAV
jgi:hypothetical protein